MGLLFNTVWFSFGTQAQALEIEGNVKYPVPMGAISSGFAPMIGFGASLYFNPMFDPEIRNFLSVAYQPYRIKADGTQSSLRLIPILFNIELPGKVFSDFYSTLGVGAGMTGGYVGATGQTSYGAASSWFTMQIKPGFDWVIGNNVSIVGHLPVTILIGTVFFSSMDFDLGMKFRI